jgi:RNA polymerase sigma-70 factor (ECF subfamily)
MAVGSRPREPAPAIAASIDAAVGAARQAWPGIAGDEPAFRARLEARAAGAADPGAAITSMCATDLWLALGCATGDASALEAFDGRYLSQMPAALARHRARDRADEVCQLVRERLLVAREDAPPRIAEYSGRGALGAWVRIAALRVASNLVRGDRDHDALDETELAGELADAPELAVLESRYGAAFRAAFRGAFAALDAEERTLLKLHFIDGISVRKLTPILGVSPATAGRRLLAAQARLGERVLAELAARVETPPVELASVVRALLSRLDVSLSVLIGG